MSRGDKVEIWKVEDAGVFQDENGKAVPTYEYVSPASVMPYSYAIVKARDGKGATLEELVRLCDQDAESINAHDFCGAHRLLAAVLCRHLGRAKATKVMLDIAERRGLHGMGGICGTRDSYHDLNVGQNGHDWNGSYGE